MYLTPSLRSRAAVLLCCSTALPALAQTQVAQVEVVGRRTSGSYAADAAEGAKSPFTLRELPQAVRVLTRQTLDDLGALRLDDALDYAGGVSRQNNFGGLWDNIAIRGLPGDINNGIPLLLNGMSASRGFNAPRDTANIERVEFLKGPAASLYGASEPGGTVNIVTKQPLWRRATALEAYAGGGMGRLSIDTTGPVSSVLAYRLNAALESRGGWRDHVDSDRVFVAPVLAWRLGESSLTYEGEYLRHRTPMDRGLVARHDRMGDLPRERFLGEPDDGKLANRNSAHQLRFSQPLGAAWRARMVLAHKDGALSGFSTEPVAALQLDERTLHRQRRYRDFASHDTSLQAELVGSVDGTLGRHEVLLGVQLGRFDLDQRMLRANPSNSAPYAIDVLAPVYGQARPAPRPSVHTQEDQETRAIYLQDSLFLGDHWRVLAGLRHDRFDQSQRNLLTGVVLRQDPVATSPRVGLSYLVGTEWSLFANAGTSFRPNSGSDARGHSFVPERGRALEAGVKWQAVDGRMGATLAVYDIRKRNLLTNDPDPANRGFSITAGEVRSRGLDLDASGEPARLWRVNGSLSIIDASITRDNVLAPGSRLLNIPRVNASLMLTRELALGGYRALLGGGLTHTGRRLGEALTQAPVRAGQVPFWLPAYTLARATAQLQLNPRWRVTVDVDNLFGRAYYPNSFQRTWVTPGPGRTFTMGLQGRY